MVKVVFLLIYFTQKRLYWTQILIFHIDINIAYSKNLTNFNAWCSFKSIIKKKDLWVTGTRGFTKKTHIIIKYDLIGFLFFKSKLWHNHTFEQMCLLIRTGFSGERSGPWAFCFVNNVIAHSVQSDHFTRMRECSNIAR